MAFLQPHNSCRLLYLVYNSSPTTLWGSDKTEALSEILFSEHVVTSEWARLGKCACLAS